MLLQTLKQTGQYHSAANKMCDAFQIFLLVPEKIFFRVEQYKIFWLSSSSEMLQEEYLEFP